MGNEQPKETGGLRDGGLREPEAAAGQPGTGMHVPGLAVLPEQTGGAANGTGLSAARLAELEEAYDTACNRGCNRGQPQRLFLKFRNESESNYAAGARG